MKKSCVIALFVFALASITWGQTTRDGVCGGDLSKCVFSGTAQGSLKVLWAWSEAGIVPIPPPGWTVIDLGHIGTNVNGYALACNVSTSSSDTGTGLWKHASIVTGISYAGTQANSTADCPTSGIGGFAVAGTGDGTDFSVPAVTMLQPSDWIAAFGAKPTMPPCLPGGLFDESSGGNKMNYWLAMDTEGIIGGWPGSTCPQIGAVWASAAVEVLSK